MPFGVYVPKATGGAGHFVAAELRQKTRQMGAEGLAQGQGLQAVGEGTVVDMAVEGLPGLEPQLLVTIRRAKRKELTKMAQEQALRAAIERGRYSSLLAQIARSKSRKVEAALIDEASRVLKGLQPKEGSFMTHKEPKERCFGPHFDRFYRMHRYIQRTRYVICFT